MATEFQLAEAYTELSLRDNRFNRGLANVQQRLRVLQAKMDVLGRHAQRMLLVAGGALGFFIKMAADAQEVQSKFNAVFKEGADEARAWSHEFATAIGRNKYAIEGIMASFQDVFVPMGFAREQGAKLSQTLTKLSVDLASFNPSVSDAKEAGDLLTSGLVGNHEAFRRFGVIVTETTLKMQLIKMGIVGGTKAASEQQKMLARLNIVMEGTSDAHGDAARTAGDMANQLRSLKAKAAEMAVVLGTVFIPVAQQVVQWLQKIIEKISGLTEAQKQNILRWALIAGGILGVVAVLPKLVSGLQAVIGAVKMLNVVARLAMMGPWGLLILALTALAGLALGAWIKKQVGEMMEAFQVEPPKPPGVPKDKQQQKGQKDWQKNIQDVMAGLKDTAVEAKDDAKDAKDKPQKVIMPKDTRPAAVKRKDVPRIEIQRMAMASVQSHLQQRLNRQGEKALRVQQNQLKELKQMNQDGIKLKDPLPEPAWG